MSLAEVPSRRSEHSEHSERALPAQPSDDASASERASQAEQTPKQTPEQTRRVETAEQALAQAPDQTRAAGTTPATRLATAPATPAAKALAAKPAPGAIVPMHGWGRVPLVEGEELRSENLELITRDVPLSRGLGRSYGDASLPPLWNPRAASTLLADRILSFDEETGLLRAEAGLSFSELMRIFLPRKWFVPVTPGTKLITLGGAVAADVHGKNHHVDGSFGSHVTRIRMRLADGRIIECSPDEHVDLFHATIGGMGLTGHILDVTFRMKRIPSPWIWWETERISNIDQYWKALKDASHDWPFTVGWIDCLSRGKSVGRGILQKGRWAEASEAPSHPPKKVGSPNVPFDFPSITMSWLPMRIFNGLYYGVHPSKKRAGIVHPEKFFYPLDAVRNWNRLYGKPGFTQYQCVLPNEVGEAGLRQLMEIVVRFGGATSLCVIKDCGAESKNSMLSFLKPGISLAIDLPLRSWTQKFVDALNEFVVPAGGRIYLAKDALTRKADFQKMEPRLEAWREVRNKWDPEGRMRSVLYERLLAP